MEINNKLYSKVYPNGILLKKDNQEEFVKIDGDRISNDSGESFVEGFFKTAAVLIFGSAYPLITGAFGAYSYYNDVYETARSMGEKNDFIINKSALKGAILGGIKGALHGVLDAMVITGLTAGALAVMGPGASVLVPFIGGFYNVVKDTVRS